MRLLRLEEDGEFNLVEYIGRDIPQYAVLSHTWGVDDEEVTLRDLTEGTGKGKVGYRKLAFCSKRARHDGLRFFWVDTCCIDKSSSAELSEAINSMFRWYHASAKCYVYLSDVTTDDFANSDKSFRKSRWFTRGWTLQELLAPRYVEFFSEGGELLGDRDSLMIQIADITNISSRALQATPLHYFSVEERMSWARERKTKREEDMAYSLLGIFDIHMPLLYGEGQKKALNRLQKEIEEARKDNLTPSFPVKAADTELAQEIEGKYSSEVAWMSIVKRRKKNGYCCNCGSEDHWESECQNTCGKCLYWGHTASRCKYRVRCMKCDEQGHLSKDCPRQILGYLYSK